MINTARNNPYQFTPYFISFAIHALLILLILSISYRYYRVAKEQSERAAESLSVDVIAASQDPENRSSASEWERRAWHGNRGKGPYGLNDEAGRELWECARSGISVTPDNFLEYIKIREARKTLHFNPLKKNDRGYAFPTGVDHKLKTDYHTCFETICGIINFPGHNRMPSEEKSDSFSDAVLDFINDKRAVRTWRTLWMVKKPASMKDKIELVRLLRRLDNYIMEGDDAGFEYLRRSILSIVRVIPDELKIPPARHK